MSCSNLSGFASIAAAFRGIRSIPVAALFALLCAGGRAPAAFGETIDDVIGRCPTNAEMDAVDAFITLSFEGPDPSGPGFVCTAAAGSRDLTRLKRNLYNLMLAAQK